MTNSAFYTSALQSVPTQRLLGRSASSPEAHYTLQPSPFPPPPRSAAAAAADDDDNDTSDGIQ